MREWQATRARTALLEIIDAAVDGVPQLIRRRDEKEVVVVSRDYCDANKPSLRNYLLTAGYTEDHDELDDALRKVREQGMAAFSSRALKLGD